MGRLNYLVLATLVVTLAASFAGAAEIKDEDVPEFSDVDLGAAKLDVMQNRKYQLLHEVTLMGGGLPVDPFYKGLTASFGYTLHFTGFFAVEFVQFTYSFNVDTKLKKELIRTALSTGKNTPEFPEIEWVADVAHVVIKPLYGKEAVFNTKVVHLETYGRFGPAFVRRSDPKEPFAFGADAGIGMRLWLAEWVAVRFDLSEMIYFLAKKPQQSLRLDAGFAFNLRGED
ncbi:MAG: outer membrane beta-barrel domain-containing protein [Deltaproteobacteria bacterium]|nr:outer membrane beta-barrel domain-containing protein [Deltaproteobacteria bacterium]